MVRSLAARRANQAVRRAAKAAAAAAMVRGASSSPPTLPAHPPALPRPHRNCPHRGNDGGEEHLLTPTVDRTIAIFDSLAAAPGLPTTAPSTTTTAAAAAAAVSNDDVNESLELDVVPDDFVCPITNCGVVGSESTAEGTAIHNVLHKYLWHARDGEWRYAGAPYVNDEWNGGQWNDEWNVGKWNDEWNGGQQWIQPLPGDC
jgi:hypothetical protein